MSATVVLRCEAILFDLDGVLVDSRARVEATWRHWAGEHNLEAATVVAAAHGRRSIDTIRQFAPHLSAEAEVAALVAGEATNAVGVYDVPGARELLAQLPGERWAIVTSGSRSVATLRIAHTRLPSPSVLVSADDISSGKPDPEGYLTAARQLGVNPEACVVVEDAPAGLAAASAAGMRAIAIGSTFPCSALQTATACAASLAMVHVSVVAGATPIVIRVDVSRSS